VLNRRRQFAGLFNSGSWPRSQTGRVLSGLVSAVTAPQIADAARNGERQADNQDRKNDDATNRRDTSEENSRSKTESDQRNDDKDSAETRESDAKSDNSGKHVRNESTNANDGGREQRATDSAKTRGDSGRNDDSNSNSSKPSTEDDDSHHHGGQHVARFEQQADEPTADSPPDNSPPTNVPDASSVTPANPNVAINDIPSSPTADLVVDANDHVVANVSTSGGFAFARSGDVIAVSGPDGASIIQTGDVSTGTSGTSPAEPSDGGGNNDVGFSS
jgi:hypothetical protein